MTKQQALNQLRIMQAWHEDNGNGPCPDYDAICYAINIIEEAPEGLDNLIKALEAEHKKLREMQKALKNVPDTNVWDTISRQAAIDYFVTNVGFNDEDGYPIEDEEELREIWTGYFDGIPPAQQNLSEEYAKAVRNWLVNYQVKCADLAGRYTPYEVLGWIVSDWRKENGIW